MFDDTPDFNSPTSTPAAVPNNPSAVPNTPSPVPTASPVPPAPGPVPTATASPTAKAATSAPPPAVVQAHHENLLGKAVRALMGTPVDYKVQPDGSTVAVPVKEKPGQLFRSILGGAILGASVGSHEHSFAGGAGAGAQAETNVINTQNKERYDQAQQSFRNQQEVTRTNREKTLMDAQIAHMHSQEVVADANLDLASQEFIDRKNQFNQVHQEAIQQAGGIPAQLKVNGQVVHSMNATQFAQATAKDPSLMQAPDGFHRMFTTKVDTAGLKFEPGKGWVDAQGNPVNMSERTTIQGFDVPNSAANTVVQVSGKELNAMAGSKVYQDDTKTHPITLRDLTTMRSAATKNELDKEKVNLQKQQVELERARIGMEKANANKAFEKGDRDAAVAFGQQLRASIDDLKAKRRDLAGMGLLTGPEGDKLDSEIKGYEQEWKGINEKLFPNGKVPGNQGPSPASASSPAEEARFITSTPSGSVAAKTDDGRLGYVPFDQLEGFLAKNKGAQVISAAPTAYTRKRLANLSDEKTMLVDSKDNQLLEVDNGDVDAFMKKHPSYRFIGRGQKKIEEIEPGVPQG